ncbi:hypothetical protein MNBD_BACTEROID01-753 [hydrothermal vent metagenome]|uniref:Alginate export domain-containing protein n=1 Tax=hydrothermal vent metagenome TaxID=652676 RepID=A0A3B0UM62_9ZZZZ
MKNLKYIGIIAAGVLFTQFAKAQFTLSGEFRPRTEISHGYKSLAGKSQSTSIFTVQRTRLNVMYQTEGVKTKLVLQDVRNWGGQAQLVTNEDFATSVHEAWAEVFFAPGLSLKAGRQELIYDDHRIFGNVGWTQQARSHDIALLKYEKGIKLHFGLAHHENLNRRNSIYQGPDAYKNLQFIWFNKKWGGESLSLLFLNNGKPVMKLDKELTKYSQTFGGRLTLAPGAIKLASNLYYQTGKDISDKNISALNFLLELSTKAGQNSRIGIGYELLSGTAWDESGKNRSFTPFYGTNHKFNGFMDYFYVGNHINSVGLNDIYLKISHSKNKFSFNSDIHYFASAAEIGPGISNYLGTELDLSAGWVINPTSKLKIGWSQLFATRSMEILRGGDYTVMQSWAYVMLSVVPTFIK